MNLLNTSVEVAVQFLFLRYGFLLCLFATCTVPAVC